MTTTFIPGLSTLTRIGQDSNNIGHSIDGWKVVSHRKPKCSTRPWQGIRLTFATLNAKFLVRSRNGIKSVELAHQLQAMRWPSVVVITETDGVAGKTDLVDKLGPRIARSYNIRWTMRSVDKDGVHAPDARRMVGAGVALLVHKRLRVSIRDLSVPGVEQADEKWLDGHLRVWRLDPLPPPTNGLHIYRKHETLQRPVIITGTYAPPRGCPWGIRVRACLFRAMISVDEFIMSLRQSEDVFSISFEHSNAPDEGCDLPLHLPFLSEDEIRSALSQAKSVKTQRATLEYLSAGLVNLLRRKHSQHRRHPDTDDLLEGEGLTRALARLGKIPLAGVMGHRQSTSWIPCAICAGGNQRQPNCTKKGCGRMRSCHDQVRVPAELIFQALTSASGGNDLIRYRTRRVWWSRTIDHAISSGFVFVAPVRPPLAPTTPRRYVATTRAPTRTKFSFNLL